MNDKPNFNGRKKLSLCSTRKPQHSLRQNKQNIPNKIKPQEKVSKPIDKSDQLAWLYKQKDMLKSQIEQIEQRLILGFSQPLKDYCIELKRKDMLISCKITEFLALKANKTQARG